MKNVIKATCLSTSVEIERNHTRPVITVITPLIAASGARNWAQVLQCLSRTARSVKQAAQQVDAEVRHLVVCEDDPTEAGESLAWVPHESDPADNPFCSMRNKGRKLVRGFRCDQAKGSDYVMILDADDLVSRRLFSYIFARPQFDAFSLSVGWEWHVNCQYMTLPKSFDRYCGSSHVWRYDVRLFPAWIGKDYEKPRIGDRGHNEVTQAMREAGIAFDSITEPLGCYVQGHGQNVSDRYRRRWLNKGRIKDWMLSPWRRRSLAAGLAEEFAIEGMEKL